MKTKKFFNPKIAITLVLCLSAFLSGVRADATKRISNDEIAKIFKQNKINIDSMGYIVEWPDGYKLTHDESKKMIPASISKLLTTLAVVKTLPVGYRFHTELYYDNKNLYLKGGGDPSFVSENMWYLVNEFTRQNIKNISGDIIVDDSLFDKVRFDDSRESVRVDRSYDAPVGAMSFNWNSVNIFVRPSSKVNQEAEVVLDPENSYFQLINKTKTVNKVKHELIVDVKQSERKIVVSGDVRINEKEKAIYKNVSQPDIWSGENLKSFLKQRGVIVSGKIKSGSVPESAQLVASYESKPMSAILADMNKFSNNYIAEMLTKNLSVYNSKTPATLTDGMQFIRKSLYDIGLKDNDFYVVNPSGFTRENLITPAAMNEVLKAIETDFRYFPTVLESLPISGVDGTLKKRMKNTKAESFVRAKTGFLDGVVTLAGYVGLNTGEIVRINFLYNGPQDEAKVRETVDQVLIRILE